MKELKRIFSMFLRPHLRRLAIIGAVSLAVSLAPYLFGYLSRIMVDQVLEIRMGGAASQVARQPYEARLRLLLIIAGVLIGVRLVLILANALNTYLLRTLAFDVIYRIRHIMHDKLQRLQVAYFDQNLTGKIMARLLDDVGTMNQSVNSIFVPAITATMTLLLGIAILFWIDGFLAILALCFLPICILTYRVFIARVREVLEEVRTKNTQMYGIVGDALHGIQVVKSFAQEGRERRDFVRKNVERLRLLGRYSVLAGGLAGLSALTSALGMAIVLYVGALRVKDGHLSVGDYLFFYSSAAMLFAPLNALLSLHVQAQAVLIAARKVFEILDYEVTIKDEEDAQDLTDSTGWVVFAGVWFRYPGFQRHALRNLTFEVPPASKVALVGASGSGKSTIADLLVRFYDPTDGYIMVDMHDLRDLKLSSLRRHIRIVHQEPILFTGTIADIIRYGYPEATDAEVESAARTAQMHDFITSLPEGYGTVVGEDGMSLSGGQKQRLSFAMALVTNPTVLILDDSTSALDAETAAQLEESMEQIMAGRTVFVITHRLSTAMSADVILVLDRGRLVEQGDHHFLMAKGGHYASLFSTQAEMQLAGTTQLARP